MPFSTSNNLLRQQSAQFELFWLGLCRCVLPRSGGSSLCVLIRVQCVLGFLSKTLSKEFLHSMEHDGLHGIEAYRFRVDNSYGQSSCHKWEEGVVLQRLQDILSVDMEKVQNL